MIGAINVAANGSVIIPSYPAVAAIPVINSSSQALNFANATTNGHYIVNRSTSTNDQAYKDGVSKTTSTTDAVFAPLNLNIYTIADNNNGQPNGTSHQLAEASIGGSLSSTDATNFYNRLRTYMTAVGVP